VSVTQASKRLRTPSPPPPSPSPLSLLFAFPVPLSSVERGPGKSEQEEGEKGRREGGRGIKRRANNNESNGKNVARQDSPHQTTGASTRSTLLACSLMLSHFCARMPPPLPPLLLRPFSFPSVGVVVWRGAEKRARKKVAEREACLSAAAGAEALVEEPEDLGLFTVASLKSAEVCRGKWRRGREGEGEEGGQGTSENKWY